MHPHQQPRVSSIYKHLSKCSVLYKAKRKIEKAKTQVRAKVEHPFRVIKRQFGYVKTRLRGLVKQLRFGWYHTELCNVMLRIIRRTLC
ncbi:hypothetical protein GCM10008969_49550 [Pseudomonas veronii subsp. inensis]